MSKSKTRQTYSDADIISGVPGYDNRDYYDEYGSALILRNNDEINATKADFRMIVGERSNGKTYPTIVFDGIRKFIDSGYKDAFAYIRRWDDTIKVSAEELFNGCCSNGWLEWYTKGKYNYVHHYRKRWFLAKKDQTGKVVDKCKTPMCYGFALTMAEHYKGPDYPMIKTIIFDEFIPEKSSRGYSPGEWRLWNSILSTIIRRRSDVVIYMIANTITKDCPYFDKYKIDIDEIPQGVIQVFRYNGGGSLAFEHCRSTGSNISKPSSKYFDIDTEIGVAGMINAGHWETDEYPKLPRRLSHKDRTKLSFWMVTKTGKIIQGNILDTGAAPCVFFHMKTTPLKVLPDDYIYKLNWDPEELDNPMIRIGFNKQYQLDKIILDMIAKKQAYYKDNDVGEKVKHFIENI